MTNNVETTKILEMEDFSFDAIEITSDGISSLIFSGGENARFEIGPGYGNIIGSIKNGQFYPQEIEIMDVGSAHTWERFIKVILPKSKGYVRIKALFEDHSIWEVESLDGDVIEEWSDWT